MNKDSIMNKLKSLFLSNKQKQSVVSIIEESVRGGVDEAVKSAIYYNIIETYGTLNKQNNYTINKLKINGEQIPFKFINNMLHFNIKYITSSLLLICAHEDSNRYKINDIITMPLFIYNNEEHRERCDIMTKYTSIRDNIINGEEMYEFSIYFDEVLNN